MTDIQPSAHQDRPDPNDHLTLVGPGLALIVVHLQCDIVEDGTAFGSIFAPQVRERDIIATVERLAAGVRENGGTVVFARIAFAPDGSDLDANLPLLQMARDADALREGSPGAQLVAGLTVADDDVVLTHTRPGPFTGTDLAELLRARAIRDVAVCGVATNASVEGAIRQAADLGFHAIVVDDACSAADEASHEASIATMGGLFARVIPVDELLAALP
ncbi:MAG: isochorismatase family cysteine hydrolase [Bowdeniella nasicola]|nr:isochorismatase family cysteine hydrolase [Bowdeniella nasicola]